MRSCDYVIYRIDYKTTFAERVSTYGGQDSELTGKRITEQRQYLVAAPTEDFAKTAFNRYHGKDEFLTIQEIGKLNDIVTA